MDICHSICMEKNSVNAVIGSLHAVKSLNSIEKTQPRMMCTSFNNKPCTTIVSSNASDKTHISTFYNELSFFVWHILEYKVLIIGGDMNAWIDKNSKNIFC